MGDDAKKESSWFLAATGGDSHVPEGFHPLADEWANIARREKATGIPEGHPILLSTETIDYRLGDYFGEAFRSDRGSTARTYASELRTWFRFLELRSVSWDEAERSDVRAFQVWRVYDDLNPRPVSPATWNKGWAALFHFYGWAKRRNWISENPASESDRLGDAASAGGYREKNARTSRDRWITPSDYRLWREVGLRSYVAELDSSGLLTAGTIDEWSRFRNSGRNVAFVDFLITTGLRLTEVGSLLNFEIPSHVDEEAPIFVKGGKRRHYRVLHQLGLQSLSNYQLGERRDAVRRANRLGTYTGIVNRLEVDVMYSGASGPRVRLTDGRDLDVTRMKLFDRGRLFTRNSDGLDPAWLWLTETGTPMGPDTWGKTFGAANERVTKARASLGVLSPGVRVTPHSLRFTFALFVLLAGIRAIDAERGIDSGGAFNVRNYTQAFDEVQHLLGHKSPTTTRLTYLEPVKGMRRTAFLYGGSLEQMWDGLVGPGSQIGFGGRR